MALEERVADADPEALAQAVRCLSDEHPRLRAASAEVLCAAPIEAVRPVLFAALDADTGDARPGQRAATVRALGIVEERAGSEPGGSEATRDRLLDESRNPDADVRFHAFTALNRLGVRSDAFAARVREAIDGPDADPDAEVAAVAASAAAELGLRELLEAVLARWRRTPARGFAGRRLAIAAAHLGADEVVPALVRVVEGGEDALEALDALRDREGASVDAALTRFAKGWRVHPVLRARAAVALAERRASGAEALVRSCLAHRKRDLRCATLDFLASTGREDLVEIVVAVLRDPRHRDSAPAAYALGNCPLEAARRALRDAASDPRPDVAEEARLALAEQRP